MIDLHWRNTQKPARFFFLDARSFVAVTIFLAHARLWTFVLALTIMMVFWLMERRGLTFESALRAMRRWTLGIKRPANHRRAIRRYTDYGA